VFHDFFGEQVFRSDLFSMGVTRGKWGTLLDAFLGFKDHYDRGAPLQEAIPRLAAGHPRRYPGLSLRDLCDQMHAELRAQQVVRLLDQAFSTLPQPVLPPGRAYQLLVRDQVEWVAVDDMGRPGDCGHGRSLSSGYPAAHAWRARRGVRWTCSGIPQSPAAPRSRVPRLQS
jgi:arginine/lysine/ornithine decarboxylase